MVGCVVSGCSVRVALVYDGLVLEVMWVLGGCMRGLRTSLLHGPHAVLGDMGRGMVLVLVLVQATECPFCIFGPAGGYGGLRGVGSFGAGCFGVWWPFVGAYVGAR